MFHLHNNLYTFGMYTRTYSWCSNGRFMWNNECNWMWFWVTVKPAGPASCVYGLLKSVSDHKTSNKTRFDWVTWSNRHMRALMYVFNSHQRLLPPWPPLMCWGHSVPCPPHNVHMYKFQPVPLHKSVGKQSERHKSEQQAKGSKGAVQRYWIDCRILGKTAYKKTEEWRLT